MVVQLTLFIWVTVKKISAICFKHPGSIVAIGKPKRQVRKASHCGNKQQ